MFNNSVVGTTWCRATYSLITHGSYTPVTMQCAKVENFLSRVIFSSDSSKCCDRNNSKYEQNFISIPPKKLGNRPKREREEVTASSSMCLEWMQ